MKKLYLLFLILLLATACETTNSNKRGSIKTIEQSIEKEIESEQVKNSKETQIASMPDVSVFFPEQEEENKRIIAEQVKEIQNIVDVIAMKDKQYLAIINSLSWKITKPLRDLKRFFVSN